MKPVHIAIEVSTDEHYKSQFLNELKNNWPSLAKDYRHFCHTAKPQVGDVWTWTSPLGQKIFHLVLDETENRTSEGKLSNFRKALREVKKLAIKEMLTEIDFPRGGFFFQKADHAEVDQLVVETFKDSNIKITVGH